MGYKGVADRVLLGLLPSSGRAYGAAVCALKTATGGWLHVHANVAIAEIESWTETLLSTLQRLLRDEAGQHGWTVEARHLERVNSYAPHVMHVVCDVMCS